MLPTHFAGENHAFGPPKDWDEKVQGVCIPVPAMVTEDPHNPGYHFVVTMWKPSTADLEALNAGEPLRLQCWGGMPPVSLYTVSIDGVNNVESLIVLPA